MRRKHGKTNKGVAALPPWCGARSARPVRLSSRSSRSIETPSGPFAIFTHHIMEETTRRTNGKHRKQVEDSRSRRSLVRRHHLVDGAVGPVRRLEREERLALHAKP